MINGEKVSAEVDPRTLLVKFLRDHLRLTGTHVGCDTTQCGACTIIFNGDAVKSCTMLAVQATGKSVITIEGLAQPDGTLHPVQEAFRKHHGLQCGFCTPGMVMCATALLEQGGCPSRSDIRAHISGNYCRCTGYEAIVDAIDHTARTRAATASSSAARRAPIPTRAPKAPYCTASTKELP
jgi:carbon-monoxide dehydrogenase small subunit